jgi:hypothetical protein
MVPLGKESLERETSLGKRYSSTEDPEAKVAIGRYCG